MGLEKKEERYIKEEENCIGVRIKGREREVVGRKKGKKEARGQKWDTKALAAHVDTTLSLFHAPYLPPPTLHTLHLFQFVFSKDIIIMKGKKYMKRNDE